LQAEKVYISVRKDPLEIPGREKWTKRKNKKPRYPFRYEAKFPKERKK